MVPWSLAGHVAIFLVAAVWSLVKPTPLPPPIYEVTLAAPIKKGTPGGGPPSTAPTPPPAGVKSTPAMVVATPPPKSGSDDSKINDAIARIEALKKAQALAAAQAKGTQVASAATPSSLAATPKATPGSGSGTGDGGSEYGTWDGIPGSATYEQQVRAIVTRNWVPPAGIAATATLQCVIQVKIGYDGTIATKELLQSSDNATFDAEAMATLMKSDPFPPPPLETKQFLLHVGLPFRFNNQTLAAGGAR